MTILLTIVFILSGAAGLMYESIWSRYLGLFVGHSAYAQVIVLVIFLGGMSAGAAIASRRSARLREPLLWYAGIELVVGVLGLGFHAVYVAVTNAAYETVFPALAGGTLLVVVKWTIAAVLILPQSILLGATFPLMSAGLIRRLKRDPGSPDGSGRVLGLLYFANSLGAAGGVLVAGFWTIRVLGLPGTLVAAAVLNIVVALAVFAAVKMEREAAEEDGAEALAALEVVAEEPVTIPPASATLWRLLLAVSFGTAVASFIYEIAWIRMLSLVLGSATHAFELMLSAFILGLALGAFWIRGRADRVKDPIQLLGVVQLAMGALAIATLGVYLHAFEWMASLMEAVRENESGYRLYNVARYGIALGVMLPSTFCAGITLPLITRTLLVAGTGERAIGAVYAWNTLGSIIGVTVAALVLMPLVGLRAMLIIGGGLDIAIGVALFWHRAWRWPVLRQTASLATAAGLAVVLGAVIAPTFDPGILASGVFRYGTVPSRGSRNMVFYKDGRTASVSVRLGDDSTYSLATNGKPDASVSRFWFNEPPPDSLRFPLRGDESTQILLPMITLAHAPHAREAAVIGNGSGLSSHMLLSSPVLERLVTIDIEREMVAASRVFRPANERVHSDPRSHFVFDDAKSYFAASGRTYDLILSEPSNPWVSGVAGLFTDEFYRRISGYLAPRGVFGQWLHLYEIDDELVLSVFAALHRNFAHYDVYLTNDVDILVVATNDAQLPGPDWSVFGAEGAQRDLAPFMALTPDALHATLLLTYDEMAPMFDSTTAPNSDFFPQLDLGAERTRFLRNSAVGFLGLTTDRFDVAAAIGQRVVPLTEDPRVALGIDRVENQVFAARLRRGETLPPTDTTVRNRPFQAARLRQQLLDLTMQSGAPPVDWFYWFTQMLAVESDRHTGTMGQVDTAWYAAVERYMVAQQAPEDGISALRFLRAAASYDWPTAAAEVQTLINARDQSRHWLPLGLFIDAAVVSRLHAGDIPGARAAFARFSTASDRSRGDLRNLLLDGQLQRVEGRR